MASSDTSETVVESRRDVLNSNDTEGDTLTLVQPASGGYISQLKPPIGTKFYEEDHVTIFNAEEIYQWTNILDMRKVGSITWRASIYAYVSGAVPDGDFEKNNGSILIVIVHSGTVQVSGMLGSSEYIRTVTGPSSVTPKVQLPPSYSGNRRGEVWDLRGFYVQIDNISHQETIPMFKNNEVFDFEAKYGQDVEQSSKELNDGWETSLKYDALSSWNHTIANLTVFETKVT